MEALQGMPGAEAGREDVDGEEQIVRLILALTVLLFAVVMVAVWRLV